MTLVLDYIMKQYEHLKDTFKHSASDESVTRCLITLYDLTSSFLITVDKIELVSKVEGKKYLAFSTETKRSRAFTPALFDAGVNKDELTHKCAVDLLWESINENNISSLSAHDITCAVYAIAISFCCSIDLLKSSDQKTPGTYFEMLIGHLLSKHLHLNPRNQMDVLSLGTRTTLPTDFIFDLGPEKAKYHVPVKTSTRERVVQVWAHQRVLDGVYGTGRFLGLLMCLSETKVDSKKLEVTEICLPDQWRLYQLFISQLKRVYYLDIPDKYKELNLVFPKICVKEFGEFFHEDVGLDD